MPFPTILEEVTIPLLARGHMDVVGLNYSFTTCMPMHKDLGDSSVKRERTRMHHLRK